MTDIAQTEQRAAPRISFVSLGCPKALVDSERILTRLRAEGYELARSHAGADAVIVNTCGFLDSAKAESLAAIGQAMNENGKVIVTGCMGADAQRDPRRFPERLGDHRPAGVRKRDGGGARRSARAARSVRRSHPRRGRAPDATPLRLSEDLRGLRPPLHVLHHPELARTARLALRRRRAARSRAVGESGRQGAHRHRAGYERLWPRPQIRREPVARPAGRRALFRHHARIGFARRLGQAAICLPLPACRRGDCAHERRQCAALYRCALPACFACGAEGDAPASGPGKDARAHPRLARDLPGPDHPLDFHRRLSRRDRGGFSFPARLAGRSQARPRRRVPIRAGQRRGGQRSRP